MFDPTPPKRKAPRKSMRNGSLLGALPEGSNSARLAKGTPAQTEKRSLLGFAAATKPAEHGASASQQAQNGPSQGQAIQNQRATMPMQDYYAQPDNDEWAPLIDPRIVIRAILDTKYLIALFCLIGLAIGIMLALSTPKMYYSEVQLLVDPRELIISDRELTPTGLPYDASLALVENQTQIIMSRRVMEQVVTNLKLGQDGEFNGQGTGVQSPLGMLRDLLSGSDAETNAKGDEFAIQSIYKSVHVERTAKSFIVLVGVRTENADKSARIANEVAKVYLVLQRDLRSETADRTGTELSQRLADLRSSVEQAERDVEMFKNENDIIDASGRRISEEEILRVSSQLTDARRRIIDLKSRAETNRSRSAEDVLSGSLPEDASSALLSDLRKNYAAKRQERDSIAERLGPRHPTLISMGAELTAINREIASELRRISQSIQVDLQRAVQGEQELAGELARLKTQQGGISGELIQLREMEREANAARAVYESFLNRARETREQGDINTANTTIISKAVPALKPSGTSRKIIAIGGLIIGFMAGFGLGVLKGIWLSIMRNPTVNTVPKNIPVKNGQSDDISNRPIVPLQNINASQASHLAPEPDPLPPSPPSGARANRPITNDTQTNMTDEQTRMGYYYYPAQHPQQHAQPAPMPQTYGYPYGVTQPAMAQQPMPHQPMPQNPMYHAPLQPQFYPQYYQPNVAPQMPPQVQHFYHYLQHPMQPQMPLQMQHPHCAPQQAPVQPPQQAAPQPMQESHDSSQNIRDRMNALRQGMAAFSESRDKLASLG